MGARLVRLAHAVSMAGTVLWGAACADSMTGTVLPVPLVATGGDTADTDAAKAAADGQHDGDASGAQSLDGTGSAADGSTEVVAAPQPPRICRPATAWQPGTKAFTDVTEAVGIGTAEPTATGLGVGGIRLSAADLDGDGLPELVVRRHVLGLRDPFEAGKRMTWLLHNDSKPGPWRFSDITQSSGLLQTRDGKDGRPTHIAVYGDIDNDGDVDVFTGMNVAFDPKNDPNKVDASEVMINDGKAKFTLSALPQFASADLRRSLNAATFVDYDRDGLLDLWLGYGSWGTQGFPIADQLVRGDGQAGFTTVTADEGLLTKDWIKLVDVQIGAAHRNTWGTAACDVNDDGHPDLLTTSYGRYFNGLWLGGGTKGTSFRFDDVQIESGWGRDDDDDWTTNWNAQCYCQDNPAAPECSKAQKPKVNCAALKASFGGKYRWDHANDREAWRLGGNTGTGVCGDLDRDGDLDFLVVTIVHSDVGTSSDPTRIVRNDGTGGGKSGGVPTFTHLKDTASGLQRTWPDPLNWNAGDITGALFDFDNDGRLDVLVASSDYPGTRAFLFRQLPSGMFSEVPTQDGIDFRHSQGAAIADFDADGDLDVALGHSLARCSSSPKECQKTEQIHVFRNDLGAQGNWLQLDLRGGKGANRSAIGARVQITAGGVTQTAEVGGGHGHYGQQNDLLQHFGLGAACDIDKVTVRWPDAAATTQTWAGVRANYRVRLRQGDAAPEYVGIAQ